MAYTKTNRLTLTCYDGDTNAGQTGIYVGDAALPDDLAITDWVALTRSLSATGIARYSLANARLDPAFGPVAGVYADVEEKAVMIFKDANGRDVDLSIPGPLATIFDAEGEEVDALDAAVSAWITATLALALSAAKVALIRFVRGYRVRYKFRK